MFKIYGKGDTVSNSEFWDGRTKYNSTDQFIKKEYYKIEDILNSIKTIFQNQNEVSDTLEMIVTSLNPSEGVFADSFIQACDITTDDIVSVTFNSITKYYTRLTPGVISFNDIIYINKPAIDLCERQLEQILQLNYELQERVEIKYNFTNDKFKARIYKIIETSYPPEEFYFLNSGEWDDDTTGYSTGIELLVDIYNDSDLNTLMSNALGNNLLKLSLEPTIELTSNTTYYWLMNTSGQLIVDTSVGSNFQINSFIHTDGVGSSINNTHTFSSMLNTGILNVNTINITSVNPSDTATLFGTDDSGDSTFHIRIGNGANDKILFESWDGGSATSLLEITQTDVIVLSDLDINGALSVDTSIDIIGDTTENCSIDVGIGRSGNGNSFIDFITDATHTGYGLRLIRNDDGENSDAELKNQGTGSLYLYAIDSSGHVIIKVGSVDVLSVSSTTVTVTGGLGVNIAPNYDLHVNNDSNNADIAVTCTDSYSASIRLDDGTQHWRLVKANAAGDGWFGIQDVTNSDSIPFLVEAGCSSSLLRLYDPNIVQTNDGVVNIYRSGGGSNDFLHLRETTDTADLVFRYSDSSKYTIYTEQDAGGSLMMTFDTVNNRIGLGQISPLQILHATRTNSTAQILVESTYATGNAQIGLKSNGASWIVSSNYTGTFVVWDDDNDKSPLTIAYNSPSDSIQIASDGGIFFSTLGSSGSVYADVMYDTSTKELLYSTSAKKFKTNIKNYQGDINLYNLSVKTYDRIDGSIQNEIGMIAEEVYNIYPNSCYFNEHNEIMGYNLNNFIAIIIYELQQLSLRIDKL